MRLVIAILNVLAALGLAHAGGPIVVGSDQRVNSFTTGDQESAQVDVAESGSFVIVWGSTGQDGDDGGVFGQPFSSDRQTVGSEIQINTVTTDSQFGPEVVVAEDGGFVVVWASQDISGGMSFGERIMGRTFSSNGNPSTAEFQILGAPGPYTFTMPSSVDHGGGGAFVVAWDTSGIYGGGVGARRFQGNGSLLGTVGVGGAGSYTNYTHSALSGGASGFVVVWDVVDDYMNAPRDILRREYDASGNPVSSSVQVNTSAHNSQNPEIVLRRNGSSMVVWEDGNDLVQARCYDSDGSPLGDQFQVSVDGGESGNFKPTVAASDNGYLVLWQRLEAGDNDIAGRWVNETCALKGSQFRINSFTVGDQYSPTAASDPVGNAIVAWSGEGPGDNAGVFMRAVTQGVPPGLIAWWPADGDGHEVLGYRAAQLTGTAFAEGVCGQSFLLDGLDDFVSVPYDAVFDIGVGDLSIAYWIKTIQTSGTVSVLDKRSAVSSTGYHAYFHNGEPGVQLKTATGTTNYIAPHFIADGLFHHVVITIDRDQMDGGRIYVDSDQVFWFDPTSQAGGVANTEPILFGRRSDDFGGDGLLMGSLDEVMITGRVLGTREVAWLYAACGPIFLDDFESGDTDLWSTTWP